MNYPILDFRFTSSFKNNAVIIIDGLRKDDMQTGLNIYNELRDFKNLERAVAVIERHAIDDVAELTKLLEQIRERAKEGLRPILHFECHGNARTGLEIGEARENLAWSALEPFLRAINVVAECNLGVMMAVCSGLHAIMPIKINRMTPFYLLVGSEDELLQEQIRSEMRAFYRELWTSGNLDRALGQVPSCKTYHAEKMLAVALGKFFRQACMGAGAEERIEMLVTTVKWQLGGFRNREQMRLVRRGARKTVKSDMSEETFNSFARTFLGVRRPSFTFKELANWIRSGA
jgi:hypothetical protein